MQRNLSVLIMTADGVEDIELQYPWYRLKEAGVHVDIAAPDAGIVKGKRKSEIPANLSFDQVDPSKYDVLVLPGGKGPAKVRKSKTALDIVRSFFDSGKLVAAICHGAQVLVSAGLVEGRSLTSWPEVREEVEQEGGKWIDQEVVQDGNLITSRMPDDLPAFMRTTLEAMGVIRSQAQQDIPGAASFP